MSKKKIVLIVSIILAVFLSASVLLSTIIIGTYNFASNDNSALKKDNSCIKVEGLSTINKIIKYKDDIYLLNDYGLYLWRDDTAVLKTLYGINSFTNIFTNDLYFYGTFNNSIYCFDEELRLIDIYDIKSNSNLGEVVIKNNCIYGCVVDDVYGLFKINTVTNDVVYLQKTVANENGVYNIDDYELYSFNENLYIYNDCLFKQVYKIKHEDYRKKRLVVLQGYNGEERTIAIDSEKELYNFGVIKSYGTKTYFALSEPCYDEGCRLSQEAAMKHLNIIYPCEHQIGKTYFCLFDWEDSSFSVIKELGFGAYLFDIDEELNIRYYKNNCIYMNNLLVKELDYSSSNVVYYFPKEISKSESVFYNPRQNDYLNIRYYGFFEETFLYWCSDNVPYM